MTLIINNLSINNLDEVKIIDKSYYEGFGRRFEVQSPNGTTITTMNAIYQSIKLSVNSTQDITKFKSLNTFVVMVSKIESEAIETYKERNCFYKLGTFFCRLFGGSFFGTHTKRLNRLQHSINRKNILQDVVDKEFMDEILNSKDLTDREKLFFTLEAKNVYMDKGSVISPKCWLGDITTLDSLRFFAFNNPDLVVLSNGYNEYVDKFLSNEIEDLLLKIKQEPKIYASSILVNGNHRTAFIVDMKNHTVEYFNSFGSDVSVNASLNLLKDKLTLKYKTSFIYHHRTEDVHLQPDSYQCSCWARLFIITRFTQGIGFNPSSLAHTNMAISRKDLLRDAHKWSFYKALGRQKLDIYLKNANILMEKIFIAIETKLKNERIFLQNILVDVNVLLDSIAVEWSKNPLVIPPDLEEIIKQA